MTVQDATRPLTIWQLARERRIIFVVALVLVLGGSALALAQPMVVGRIIDIVEHGGSALPWVATLVVIAAMQITSETYGGYLQQIIGENGSSRARKYMSRAILRSALRPLARHQSGDLVSRFTTDADALREGVARGYIQVVTATVTAAGAGTMLWFLDSVLFLLVATIMLVAGAGAWLFLRRIEAASAARQQTLGTIGATVNRALVGMRTIRVFHATDREQARLHKSFDNGFETGRRYAIWTSAVTPAVELAATGSFLALLLGGGMRVATDQISLATLISALLYSTILVVPIGTLIEATVSLSTAKGALQRINEVISLPDESTGIDQAPAPYPIDNGTAHQIWNKAPGLHIDNLSAGYDESPAVLDGMSLSVPAGRSLLIRGPSGSGKTTLINVICRFLQPITGTVVLEGTDLLRLTPDEARHFVTIAEQDSPVLSGDVRETLAYGDVHATDLQMLTVLERLGLLTDLGGPHHALDRDLGEHGNALSGGQRQRLALARALLADRPLLIVDEPTTGLDETNRQFVVSALQRRHPDQTLLIISHDDKDQEWVDQVVQLSATTPLTQVAEESRNHR